MIAACASYSRRTGEDTYDGMGSGWGSASSHGAMTEADFKNLLVYGSWTTGRLKRQALQMSNG